MGHGPRFFVGIAFAVLSLRGVAVRADVPSRSIIGEIGRATSAAAISGNYAVVGEGNRIALYDIATPTAVAAIGFSDSFGDVVRGVIVSGTCASTSPCRSSRHAWAAFSTTRSSSMRPRPGTRFSSPPQAEAC